MGLIETAEKMYLVKIAKKTLIVTKIYSEMYDELYVYRYVFRKDVIICTDLQIPSKSVLISL